MAVRTARLVGPLELDSTVDMLVESDVGRTALVKAVWLANASTVTKTITLHWSSSSGSTPLSFYRRTLAASESVVITADFVFANGECLWGSETPNTGTGVKVTMAGSYLLGVMT